MRLFLNKGIRLSIPVKVMFFTGVVYLVTWLIGVWIPLSKEIFGVQFRYIYWVLQVIIISTAATFGTYYFLDRPLGRLIRAMLHAEDGDFLIRAPVLSRDELGDLARSFNHMLSRLTDVTASKIEAEHDLIAAQEELKYRKQIEEKSQIIERTNRTLEHMVKDMSLIYEIGQEVNSVIDLDKLYENITAALEKYIRISEFAILVFDEKKETLHVKAARGFTDNEAVLRMTLQKGEGISGIVAETGKKIYIKDTREEKRFLRYKEQQSPDGSSFISIPLIYKNEILGVINFGRPGVSNFSFSDIKMLTLVAGHVALAIANARLYTKTRELSVKDELTQVYNRRHFQHMLQMEWKRSVRFYRDLSLVMVDVDDFKKYNDAYGHLQGDEVLRQIGEVLKCNLREVDTVARFGGEEFVLLLPDTDKHGALAVAEKVRLLMEQHVFMTREHEKTRLVTISAGIATYPDDVQEIDDLIDHADIALYRAKEEGRNRIICYSPPTKPKKIVAHSKGTVVSHEVKPMPEKGSEENLTPPTKTLQ